MGCLQFGKSQTKEVPAPTGVCTILRRTEGRGWGGGGESPGKTA